METNVWGGGRVEASCAERILDTQIKANARKTRLPAKELSTFLKLYTMKTKGRSQAFVIKKVLRIHVHWVVT